MWGLLYSGFLQQIFAPILGRNFWSFSRVFGPTKFDFGSETKITSPKKFFEGWLDNRAEIDVVTHMTIWLFVISACGGLYNDMKCHVFSTADCFVLGFESRESAFFVASTLDNCLSRLTGSSTNHCSRKAELEDNLLAKPKVFTQYRILHAMLYCFLWNAKINRNWYRGRIEFKFQIWIIHWKSRGGDFLKSWNALSLKLFFAWIVL